MRLDDNPVLIVNGDLVTRIHFGHMMAYHMTSTADATVATVPRASMIPYGVVETNADDVIAISEKPLVRFHVLAGIGIISPRLIRLLPDDQPFDMPDLLQSALRQGWRVQSFPIHEDWFDLGMAEGAMRGGRIQG